jgi:hypothetical protein
MSTTKKTALATEREQKKIIQRTVVFTRSQQTEADKERDQPKHQNR